MFIQPQFYSYKSYAHCASKIKITIMNISLISKYITVLARNGISLLLRTVSLWKKLDKIAFFIFHC